MCFEISKTCFWSHRDISIYIQISLCAIWYRDILWWWLCQHCQGRLVERDSESRPGSSSGQLSRSCSLNLISNSHDPGRRPQSSMKIRIQCPSQYSRFLVSISIFPSTIPIYNLWVDFFGWFIPRFLLWFDISCTETKILSKFSCGVRMP